MGAKAWEVSREVAIQNFENEAVLRREISGLIGLRFLLQWFLLGSKGSL